MNCPICTSPIPANAQLTCTVCWFEKVPAKDRRALGTMLANKQPIESKLASVVAKIKAKELREHHLRLDQLRDEFRQQL